MSLQSRILYLRGLAVPLTLSLLLALTLAGVVVNERATADLVLPWVKSGEYMTDAYRETAAWIDEHSVTPWV